VEVVREEGDKRLVREREKGYSTAIQRYSTHWQPTLHGGERRGIRIPHQESGFGAGRGEELQPLAAPLFL